MAIAKPGEFITAKCSRCKDVTGHVVMLVVSGEITKVECKACGSVHKYRDSKKVVSTTSRSTSVKHVRAGQTRAEARDIGVSKTSTRSTSQRNTAAKVAAQLETAWQEAMVRHSAETPTHYTMTTIFEQGMFVEHPTFGRGEVIQVIRPDKVEILFESGIKTLRCAL